MGFDGLSGDLGYVPSSVQTSDSAECEDGELRMILRRLTKRDAVTKLKVGLSPLPEALVPLFLLMLMT